MKSLWISVFAIAALVFCGINLAPDVVQGETTKPKQSAVDKPEPKPPISPQPAVRRGIDWLVSVQGNDGGWGQDGGETSFVLIPVLFSACAVRAVPLLRPPHRSRRPPRDR